MIQIPSNFIDPFLDRERGHYDDPVYSREAIVLLIEHNKGLVPRDAFSNFYSESAKKQQAFDYRIKAMIRDAQLIEHDDQLSVLSYWPCLEGTVVEKENDLYLVVDGQDNVQPVEYLLSAVQPEALFSGDCGIFSLITHLQTVVLKELKEPITVYAIGYIKNAKDYLLPAGYAFAVEVCEGVYKGEILSAKSLQKKEYNTGMKVYVRIDRQATGPYILSEIMDFQSVPKGIHEVITKYNLAWTWPQSVDKETRDLEAAIISITSDRVDLTELPFVTIDGITAKDFDDAVYVQFHEDRSFDLYVAIADVAHYVQPGSAIDKEAAVRGVSVYFPRYVIPMLPEVLSNDLCSLKPDVLRYALVCQMHFSSNAERLSYKFYPGIICSQARLTYDQVQRRDIPMSLKRNIADLWDAYAILKESRQKRGSIAFSQQALHFDLGENERVLGISKVENLESHHLIEEMMLAANESAALFIKEHSSIGVYRIHDSPAENKVQLLNMTLKGLGHEITAPYTLEKISEASLFLQNNHPRLAGLMTRIMQRAGYHIQPDRHFGLNFDLYTHFTSPIRRYPDLVVHRLIYTILGKKKGQMSEQAVKKALDRVNYLERRAEESERYYQQILKARYALTLDSAPLDAFVSGLSSFGVFVEVEDYAIDGLIHVSLLGPGYWTYDAQRSVVISDQSGTKEWRIGDSLKVRVKTVDLETYRVHFEPVI